MAKEPNDKVAKAYKLLEKCRLCARRCGVNRLKGELGFCKAGEHLMVSSAGPHFGEESVLVGRCGSGTIFLTSCNLGCIFCQNYDISHLKSGRVVSTEDFVDMMLSLQRQGCHNINFVTPTHFAPQILEAIYIAKEKGLALPTVYNCGGYESLEMLEILEGAIDIYMPDAKYWDGEVAKELSDAQDYPQVMRAALKEMHRQVGDLVVDREGIARRGLLVRHLVMPNGLAGTKEIMHFIAKEISPNTYVNIMEQYRPCFKGLGHPRIGRPITVEEYGQALEWARQEGL